MFLAVEEKQILISHQLETIPFGGALAIGCTGLMINKIACILFKRNERLGILIYSNLIFICSMLLIIILIAIKVPEQYTEGLLKIVLALYCVLLSYYYQSRCKKLLKTWQWILGHFSNVIVVAAGLFEGITSSSIKIEYTVVYILPVGMYMFHIYKILKIVHKNPLENIQHTFVRNQSIILLVLNPIFLSGYFLFPYFPPYQNFSWITCSLVGLLSDITEFLALANKHRIVDPFHLSPNPQFMPMTGNESYSSHTSPRVSLSLPIQDLKRSAHLSIMLPRSRKSSVVY